MIAAGHRSGDVWSYTPRQLRAFLFIAERRKTKEKAEALTLATLASRGEIRAVKRQIQTWIRE